MKLAGRRRTASALDQTKGQMLKNSRMAKTKNNSVAETQTWVSQVRASILTTFLQNPIYRLHGSTNIKFNPYELYL
jgi:hypothetical protein